MKEISQINQLSVNAGKAKQSSQTGYYHHCYEAQAHGENKHDTIPIIENFLFALALFRTRTSESVLEGKSLIEKLLHFLSQDENKANFPIYLHDFPQCKDRYIAAHVLIPLYWILKQFYQVLGTELRDKLEITARKLLTHCLEANKEKQASYPILIKIGAAAKAFGIRWSNEDLIKEGENILTTFNQPCTHWYSPSNIGEILSSLQLVYPSISHSPWHKFWEFINQTWHRTLLTYVGPSFREFQSKHEPSVTLYDLYMGYLTGKYSARSVNPQMTHLQGALIHPMEETLDELKYPFKLEVNNGELKWLLVQQEKYAYCVMNRNRSWNPATDKGMVPFKLLWGDEKRVHTFTTQADNASAIDFLVQNETISLKYFLNEPAIPEDKEKNRDITFYCDDHEKMKFLVEEQQSSTFLLNQRVCVVGTPFPLSIKFMLNEHQKDPFFGHFMRGNRPSQLDIKGENRFKAFDWQIFLRAVRRQHPCCVTAEISLKD